jgi:DNA-binding LacI/PurR family transcriptional regulator
MANGTTIQHVAKRAGVSTATVSHVINNTRFVSDGTRQRVLQVIQELNYFPSAVARGLATQETKTIGIIVCDIANPFFTSLFKAIEHELAPLGYDLILENTGEHPEEQEHSLRVLLAKQVDGIILAPSGHPSPMLQLLSNKGAPVVLVDRSVPELNLPLVEVNNQQAAFAATSHLIADGHRRIGVVYGIDTASGRLAGYQQAMQQHGLPIDDSFLYCGNSSLESGREGAKALLSHVDPPTALFTTNNLITLGALHALRELRLRCPEDVALIGFDDTDWASIFTPPMTVVQQPTREIGQTAAKLLNQLMSERELATIPLRHTFPAQLIVRGSCSVNCLTSYMHQGGSTNNLVPALDHSP